MNRRRRGGGGWVQSGSSLTHLTSLMDRDAFIYERGEDKKRVQQIGAVSVEHLASALAWPSRSER